MLNKDGVAAPEQIVELFPDKQTLIKPKAILECFEEIPCNPCSTSCPVNAIEIGENINDKPELHVDVCTGCGICIFSCPGLAIMVAQLRGDKAVFRIPYEMLPLPTKDDVCHGIDRNGNILCDALIENVSFTKRQDRTAILTVVVDAIYLHQFSTIRVKEHE
jgi:Fe-S-cluster-containing hydrogenase component 2